MVMCIKNGISPATLNGSELLYNAQMRKRNRHRATVFELLRGFVHFNDPDGVCVMGSSPT